MMAAGVLNIDKLQSMTSHDVVSRIRRVSNMRRVGHAGTLDPLATGVLLLCVGRATRLVEYLMGQPKQYITTVRLGQTTDSYDAEGDVVTERPYTHVTTTHIAAALEPFRGTIQQQPPMYSAIKKDGQPLYKLARQGKEVERPSRSVHIYSLEMTAWEPPHLSLSVTCSSGTYIRSLAHDLGESLGCGGHVTALRRTAVGDFTLATAIPLDALTPDNWLDYLLPSETAVAHLPRLNIAQQSAQKLQMGQQIMRTADHPAAPLVRIYTPDDQFIGLAVGTDESWQPHKIFQGIH